MKSVNEVSWSKLKRLDSSYRSCCSSGCEIKHSKLSLPSIPWSREILLSRAVFIAGPVLRPSKSSEWDRASSCRGTACSMKVFSMSEFCGVGSAEPSS